MRHGGCAGAALLALGLAACGGGSDSTRVVTVSAVREYWSTAGIVGRDADPIDSVVLLQADGAGGTKRVEAAAQADGTWTARLPRGPYWAEVRRFGALVPDLIEVGSGGDVVDLGGEQVALRPLPSVETLVTFEFQGLLPWEAGDSLAVHGWDPGLAHEAVPGLEAGATQGALSIAWRDAFLARLIPSDVLRLSQVRRSAASDGGRVTRLVASVEVAGLTLEDGVPLTVNLPALVAPAATLDLPLDLRAGAFASALQSDAVGAAATVTIDASPHPDWVAGSALRLLTVEPVIAVDRDLGVIAFGNPAPPSWQLFRSVRVQGRVNRAIPGSGLSVNVPVSITRSLEAGSAGPIAPVVTPVRELRVGGQDASVPLTGVGTAPRVTWSAPVTGQPTRYFVQVMDLVPGATSAQARRVCIALVEGTSVELPAGALVPGHTYYLQVLAGQSGLVFGSARYWRVRLPVGGAASLVSATIQP